jgi:hypothetical protein
MGQHTGDISNSTGIAVGKDIRQNVNVNSVVGAFDADEVRAELEGLYAAIGGLDLPLGERIAAQTATGNAVAGLDGEAEQVTSNLEKVGQALQQAETTIERGSALWERVQRLATLLGPVVGGAGVVAGWFGIPVP